MSFERRELCFFKKGSNLIRIQMKDRKKVPLMSLPVQWVT